MTDTNVISQIEVGNNDDIEYDDTIDEYENSEEEEQGEDNADLDD